LEKLINKTWRELTEEMHLVSRYLRSWWGGMSESEQLFFVGVVSAAILLLGLRRPNKRKPTTYNEGQHKGAFEQFLFCSAFLLIFTFGIDIVVESFR